jgi:para-nitrobenzyl esterase
MASLAEAEEAGAKLAAPILGAQSPDSPGDALKKLRAASAEELLKAQAAETVHPIVDGFVLPQSVSEIFAQGRQNDVPLLLGNNADEGRTLAPQAAALKASLFVSGSHTRFGALADQFLKIYPAESDQQAVNSFYAAYRDQAFGWEMRTWARMQTKTGRQPAYLYYFTRVAPGPAQRLGAFHALELAYVFGNFPWPFPWEDADHKLSDAMVRYWVNFAATGNPNTFAGTGKADTIAGTGNANKSNLPKWPEYLLQPDTALELGDVITVRSETNKAGLDFFDGYFQSLRAESGDGGASAQGGKAVK